MQIEYVFIKSYRNLNSQGFNLSNRFLIEFDDSTRVLNIRENPFFIPHFYGDAIKSLKGIVGENGVGKTTFLNYLKEVLSFPRSTNPLSLDCVIVLFDSKNKQFHTYTHGAGFSKISLNIPKSYKFFLEVVRSHSGPKTGESIFESIPEYQNSSIVYLSNVFDHRTETNYGPRRRPHVYNLSTNYLVKSREVEQEPIAAIKQSEIFKSIKFILDSRSDDFLPPIKYPEAITIRINNIIVEEFLAEKNRDKKTSLRTSVSDQLRRVLGEQRESSKLTNKLARIEFWLKANLLIDIHHYVPAKHLSKFLDLATYVENNGTFFKKLQGLTRLLLRKNVIEKIELVKDFSWTNYMKAYEKFYNTTIELFKNGKDLDNPNEFQSFQVRLNNRTKSKLLQLCSNFERTVFSTQIISMSWNDLSTGETMLLRFFANLYSFRQVLPRSRETEPILFLFDEIDTFYHPQWQKKLIKSVIDFINFYFNGLSTQIIFTAHSPLIISDLPKTHLIFLKRRQLETIVQDSLNDHKQTFGANIHSLLSDSFFLSDGHMGEFANQKISELVELLVDGKSAEIENNLTYIEAIINIIGEDVIKRKIIEQYENRIRTNMQSIRNDIAYLKSKL